MVDSVMILRVCSKRRNEVKVDLEKFFDASSNVIVPFIDSFMLEEVSYKF